MEHNFQSELELPARGLNFAARAVRFLATFLLVSVTLGAGAGLAPAAQAAADDPAAISFEVQANPKNPPVLCLDGKKRLQIYVAINKSITKTINGTAYELPRGMVTGVNIKGEKSNDVGVLDPPNTSLFFYNSDELAALKPRGIGEADFLFTAKKAGTTVLTFSANVPGAWTGSPAEVGNSYPAKKARFRKGFR